MGIEFAAMPKPAKSVARPLSAILPRTTLDRSRHAAPQVFEQLRARIVSMELAPAGFWCAASWPRPSA
jgi:hypothetical protein